ncbi:MAG: GspL/Epsl periplasmic domain-containing protein [Nitrospirota bacterium]
MARVLFIDIKDSEVQTYLLESGRSKYELQERKKYPLSDRRDLILDPAPPEVENTYVSLPLSSLNFRVIDLPFANRDKVRDVLPFELDNIILGGSEKVVFDAVPLNTAGNADRVLAVYVDKRSMGDLLGKFRSQNADPAFVTSLELRKALAEFSTEKLLSPVHLEEEERLSLAIDEIRNPTVNLRRDEYAYTRDIDKMKKSLRWTAILAILIAVVVLTDLLLNIAAVRSDIATVKNDMRKEYRELFPEEKNVVNELHQMKSHLKELKTKEELYLGINPLGALLKISSVDRQGVVFHEMTMDNESLTLKGEAPTLTDIQRIKESLDRIFEGVTISDSKSSAQGRMLFTITAKENIG